MKNKVCVFCSAKPVEEYLGLAYELGSLLAKNGFTTITGGGFGLMDAVNKGAREQGGPSWGIRIPSDPTPGKYFTHTEMQPSFEAQFNRLLEIGNAFIVLPGGLGTITEVMGITQRKKFGEMAMETPLIFVGTFFKKLIEFFYELDSLGFIREPIDQLFSFTLTAQETISVLQSKIPLLSNSLAYGPTN